MEVPHPVACPRVGVLMCWCVLGACCKGQPNCPLQYVLRLCRHQMKRKKRSAGEAKTETESWYDKKCREDPDFKARRAEVAKEQRALEKEAGERSGGGARSSGVNTGADGACGRCFDEYEPRLLGA